MRRTAAWGRSAGELTGLRAFPPRTLAPVDSPDRPLLDGLAAYAHAAAHRPGTRCRCASDLIGVLADRDDGTVVRHGRLVAKAHAPGTDPEAHRARLALAAHRDVSEVFLQPLPTPTPTPTPASEPIVELEGRPVTVWPYGPPVDPADPDAAPWEEAARLLALLHRTPPPPGLADRLPDMRAPAKAALAVDRMRRTAPDHPATTTVLAAWRSVPDDARRSTADSPAAGPRLLCHGDFHLGQLVRDTGLPLQAPWRLIDMDDVGLGDPAWDLARPAAWFAMRHPAPGGLVPFPRRVPGGGRPGRGPRSLGPTRRARPRPDGPDGGPGPREVDGGGLYCSTRSRT